MPDDLDDILATRISAEVTTQVNAALSGVLQGDPGASAYQVAVAGGFTGTAAEWLLSLKGEPGSGSGTALTTPSPFVGDGHFLTGWASYAASRDAFAARLRGLPKRTGSHVVVSGYSNGNPNVNAFAGVVRLPEPDAYFHGPHTASKALIQRNGAVSQLSPSYAGISGAYSDHIRLPISHRVAAIPYQANDLVAYNHATGALDTLKTGLSGSWKYNSGCTTLGRYLVLAPHNANHVGVWDDLNNVWFTIGAGQFTVPYGYAGAVAFPDGIVMLIPHMETRACFVNVVAGTVSFGPSIFPGNEGLSGAALLDDNKVVCFNHKYAYCIVFDRAAGTVTNFPVQVGTSGTANWRGGTRMADGRFALAPFQQNYAKALNFMNNTVDTFDGNFGSGGACGGVVQMDNCDLLYAPFNSSVMVMSKLNQGLTMDPELALSPHS